MYGVVKTLIDGLLMGPQLAPFTTLLLVIMIALAVVQAFSNGDVDDLPFGDTDE